MKSLFVRAEWDEEACVWVATSDDVPGLATEAETTEALMDKLKVMIPGLMETNGYGDGEEISFELFSRRFETARRLHA